MLSIYKITNLINNKVYIGQTRQDIHKRFIQHCSCANRTHPYKSKLHEAIRKYGKDNFNIECIDIANNLDELNEKEIFWIKYYNSLDINFGYNITSGGGGTPDYHHSEEIKRIISEKGRGIKRSEQVRKNMSEAQKKVKHKPASEQTKLKMSLSRTGHKTSDETRQKISNSNKGKIRTAQQNLDNKERQTGKKYISNLNLKISIIAMPNELDYYLINGWIVGKDVSCKFLPKKEYKKLFIKYD